MQEGSLLHEPWEFTLVLCLINYSDFLWAPCCPPESKKSPLNTYQPELHSHIFHCREISVDRFLCCLQRVANWLRNDSGCFCETLKANRESPAHVWHWKITSLIKLFQSSFLKLSHPRTGDPLSKKERWWSSGAESVCCVEQRHESWILAYQGCLVGFDVRRVWPLPRCPRRCLFFNLWRPQSNLCDPTVVLFRGNTSHVVKSSSAWMNGWALKFYSSLFLSPSSS